VPSTPADIAAALARAQGCRRVLFETDRMAPMLYHSLSRLGLAVVCVEGRQAYQALKSLATHKTNRNDARGLAHLARTGFFKPVHVAVVEAGRSDRDAAWTRGRNARGGGARHRVVAAPYRAGRLLGHVEEEARAQSCVDSGLLRS
jgi:hypothetical protein